MLKIQFLNGGLANQAFQYIFAKHYELSHPGEIMYLDDSYFALNTVHNGYELGKVFGIKPHMLSEAFDKDVWEYMLEERRKGKSIPQIIADNGEDIVMVEEKGFDHNTHNPFNGKVLTPTDKGYHPEIQDVPNNVYYHGYWINSKWFNQYHYVFRMEFKFPSIEDAQNRELMGRIIDGQSLAIHVRRGDFVTLGYAYPISDYRYLVDKWIDGCGNNWTAYIFSDDIGWCRDNADELGFNLFDDTVYVEGNDNGKNYIDLYLMSRCKGMILSNSSFSYLAGLLNNSKKAYLESATREKL